MKLHHTQSEDNGLAMGWVVVAGHLHLQLRHYASELVVDRNISYGQMLRSGDTVPAEPGVIGETGGVQM